MRSLGTYKTVAAPLIVGALLFGCDGAGDKMGPTGTDVGGGLQADLIGGGTQTAEQGTEWLTRALLYPDLTSDDARVNSWMDVAENDADDPTPFNAVPFEFDPFKTWLVRARWLHGMGCPTDATVNDGNGSTTYHDPACPVGDPKDKRNEGVLMAKTGPTSNIASSGVDIKGVKGIVITELGFDIRAGSHCGNGAPRWNITTTDGSTYFVGCNTGVGNPQPTASPTPTVPWDRLRWTAALLATPGVVFPTPIPAGQQVKSISIIFDEGQDTPFSSGMAVLDNIDINGQMVGRGPGN